jgi:hypothetical protein
MWTTQDRIIDETVEAIKAATAEALKSKKASRQFLIDAGIIPDRKKSKATKKK